jgi:DUF4097 and DUF4098 domain-containing protein YvlB
VHPLRRNDNAVIGIFASVLILVFLLILAAVLFIVPLRSVDTNETRTANLSSGTSALALNLKVDAGDVTIRFVDNASVAATLHVQGVQRSGLLWTPKPVNITWEESGAADALTINASVHLDLQAGLFNTNDIKCQLDISRLLRTSLDVENSFGGIDIATIGGVNLTQLDVKTSMGKAELTMVSDTILSGPLTLETSLGSLDLTWDDVTTTEGTNVSLKTSAGAVSANIAQNRSLSGNVTMAITTSLGSVDLSLYVSGDTSARILSTVSLGEVKVLQQSGFDGNGSDLRSVNYPQPSNMEVSCTAGAGSVQIEARYAA